MGKEAFYNIDNSEMFYIESPIVDFNTQIITITVSPIWVILK